MATSAPTPTSKPSSPASPAAAAHSAARPTTTATGIPAPMPISKPFSVCWPAAPAEAFYGVLGGRSRQTSGPTTGPDSGALLLPSEAEDWYYSAARAGAAPHSGTLRQKSVASKQRVPHDHATNSSSR